MELARERLLALSLAEVLPSVPWWLAAFAFDTVEGGLAMSVAAGLRVVGDVRFLETLARVKPQGLGRGVEAVGVAAVYSLALALGVIAGGVGALWVLAAWGLWLPVVVLDRRGLAHSADLTRGHRAEVLATWLPATIAMWLVPLVVASFARSAGSTLDTAATLGAASLLVLHPLQTAVAWALHRRLCEAHGPATRAEPR